MRILVTGSRGTLGIPLCKELRLRHEVYGCDLAHSADDREWRVDIREFRQLQEMFHAIGPEIVVHLAAEFGRKNGLQFFEQMWQTNVLGTRNVIELCQRSGAKLIYASSSEAYGLLADEYVLNEDLLDDIAPRFHNEYALSKWVNEQQVKLSEVPAVGMRIFNVYGPGEHFNLYRSVVCRFIHAALAGKKVQVTRGASRQLLYVTDFVRSAAAIVERFDACAGKCINIAHPDAVAMQKLAEMCGADYVLGDEPGNVLEKKADIELARTLLGHDPQVSLRDGIERTRAWMQSR